jgi:hypothetical protein
VLWVRSYRISDHVSRIAENDGDLGSFRGQVRILIGNPNVHGKMVGYDDYTEIQRMAAIFKAQGSTRRLEFEDEAGGRRTPRAELGCR